MTEPNRIWINDKWEAYLRPTFEGDTSGYILAALEPQPAPDAAAIREALQGMLSHSCVADAGADMKDPQDHEAERKARAILALLTEKPHDRA